MAVSINLTLSLDNNNMTIEKLAQVNKQQKSHRTY